MTFRTIDTDMENVGATTTPAMGSISRRSRSARRAAVLGARTRQTRVRCFGSI